MSSALARREVSTHTEIPGKDTATQVSGSRKCHQLALEANDSRGNSCVRCDQVDYHLHKEEKTGHNCRRLPSEGNRGSNMPGSPSS